MIKVLRNGMEFLSFENLVGFDGIDHFVTTRNGGYSHAPYGEFNLSYNAGEDPSIVTKNRALLAEVLNTDTSSMYFPIQCHKGNVKEVKKAAEPDDLNETDALITNDGGIFLVVLVADCVPVLIYDPVQKAVAAVHAGWRGTVAGIIQNTVNKLIETYRCNPRHLIAAIGPSVSPEVYQVGSEVIQHVTNYYRTTEGLVSQINHEGKGFLNLWEAGKNNFCKPDCSAKILK
jgi:YfiH family protein